jgi:N-acylglucosamine 2-epimerase
MKSRERVSRAIRHQEVDRIPSFLLSSHSTNCNLTKKTNNAHNMQTVLKNIITKYEDELLNRITPFWEKNSPDIENGGFFTCLDRQGKVYDTEKYMWMQWRNVYMFATLFKTKYSQNKWLDIAVDGFDFLTKHGKKNDGGYYFSLNKKGDPSCSDFGGFSIFTDSFAAIASAALYHATGAKKYKTEAVSSAAVFMDNIRKSADAQTLSGKVVRKQLGHYMIFLNVGFILNKSLITDEYESEIKNAVNNIMGFWNDDLGLMFENIYTDGSFDLESADGRLINPGHALEAMWFILQYADDRENKQLTEKACALTGRILDYGWDHECGGLFYFKDALGRPLLEPKTSFKIWWAHCEAAVAALYAYKMTGEAKFLDWFLKIDSWAWKNFNDPEYGEWFGYVDRKGNVCHSFKGSNWKAFFHLPRYLLTCINLNNSITNNVYYSEQIKQGA